MDWLEQTQDMFKAWMGAQQKMWDTWTATPKTESSWEKTVQTWENSVKNLVETQALWARMWARTAITNNTMPNAEEFVKSVEAMTTAWVETQQKLWANWFSFIKQFDPASMTETSQEQMMKAMSAWQDNIQKVTDAQVEWTKNWASQFTKEK